MILTGMGPVDPLPSVAAKVFASNRSCIASCTRFHLDLEDGDGDRH